MDENLDTGLDTSGAETGAGPAEGQPAEPANALAAIEQSLGYAEKPEAPELDAEGKPLEKPAVDKPAVGADGKPVATDKPAAKPGEKKAPDYAEPPGLSPDGKRRFQSLVGDNKALRTEMETLKAQTEQFKGTQEAVQGFTAIFDDSKMQPEQFGLAVDYVKAVNTKDYERAAQILANELHNIQLITGRDFTAPDPLKNFPDLAAEVAEQKITRQRALEIARGRANENTQRQGQHAREQSEKQQREMDAAINKGGQAVSAWCAAMAAKDIDWAKKEAALGEKIDWLATNVPPHQWVAHLEQFYGFLKSAPAPAQRQSPQPLRANGGAGGAKAAPGSMLEAMDQGLGYAAP